MLNNKTSGPPSTKRMGSRTIQHAQATQEIRNTEKTVTPNEKHTNNKLSTTPNNIIVRKLPTIIQSSNNAAKAPVVRYHNIDDDDDPEEAKYSQKPQPQQNNQISATPHVPTTSKVIVNNVRQLSSHNQLKTTEGKSKPPQTSNNMPTTLTATKNPPTPYHSNSPQLCTRNDHFQSKIFANANTESLDALTNQFKRLGTFPINQKEHSITNFSEEWMRKKKAAIKRRKTKLRSEELARKVINHWKWFARNGLNEIKAKNMRNNTLIFKCFQHWKRRKEDRENIWKREFIMQTRHKFSVMQYFFMIWRQQLNNNLQKEQELSDVACKHFIKILKIRALKSLQTSCEIRRTKRYSILVADKFEYQRNVRRVIGAIKEIKIMRDKINFGESHYTNVLLRKAWSALKQYIQEEAEIKIRKATEYYDLSIQRKAFGALKQQVVKYIEKRKILATKLEIVDRFFKNKTLRMVFNCLAQYCHMKTEKRKKLNQAEEYFRNTFLSSYFNNWIITLHNKMHFQELENIVVQKQRKRELKQVLMTWKDKLCTQRHATVLEEKSERFRCESLIRKSLFALSNYLLLRKEKHQLSNKAEIFHRFSCLYKGFRQWKDNYLLEEQRTKSLHDKIQPILRRKHKFLKSIVLRALAQHACTQKEKKAKEDSRVAELKAILECSKVSRIFIAWRHYYENKVIERINIERAALHHNRILKEKGMKQLFAYVLFRRRNEELHRKALQFSLKYLAKPIFDLWNNIVQKRLNDKCSLKKADFLMKKHLAKKTFAALKNYVYYARVKSKLEIEALENRNALLLRRGLIQWMESACEHHAQRMRKIQLDHTKSEFEALQRVEKYARHWLYITIRNAQKRGSYLFSGYRKTNITQSDHHQQQNAALDLTQSRGPPKRRPSPRIPNELLFNFPINPQDSLIDTTHSQPSMSDEELKVQKQVSFQIQDSSPIIANSPIGHNENVRNTNTDSSLIEEIDKIKNVLEEFENNWTPIYEMEKDKRKYLRELIDIEDDYTNIQELTLELNHLEKRAKTYLKFKREELPKLIEQLHRLLLSSCDPALL
ncbi:hypothetical protein C9374_006941 [Naegleria lovaniensis]|uniref:Sfi1 spindle body domain-containing protein n=1 Tax=Naegleria lovaniensis TaxID=51637 RepID=A0AA88GYP8_NAELO|nr:uncharacterized protein C9374_006941 [Naegleria lovaniensis]KAG2393410.1 hypothetical protein C9374_006941 [Naegleria lovaniensis]